MRIEANTSAPRIIRRGFTLALAGVTIALAPLPQTISAQAPPFGYAVKAGGSGGDFSRAIAADDAGGVYVTGSFSGSATFGATNLASQGNADLFIAKHDSAGRLVWLRQAGGGGTATEEGRAICISPDGHVYATGGFSGMADFGGASLTSAGGLDIFIAKYDGAGQLVWARRAGGTGAFEYGLGIALDAAQNIYVTGQFSGTATFGNTNLTSRGGFDGFLSKYDSNGVWLWTEQLGGSAADYGRGVAADADGNSYVAGWYEADATIGSLLVTNAGGADIFTARFGPAGNMLWLRRGGGLGNEISYGIALDAARNCYTLGWVETSTPGATSILITKFNVLGIALWSRTARVNTDITARGGIAADGAGNIYVTSQFSSTALFGVTNVTSQGASDAFVASYDTSGAVRWVKQAGGGATEEGRAIAVDPFGNCYFTGWFTGNAPFGGATLTNSGVQDIFIAKLEARPALNISRLDGQVLLSWPIAAAGFQLESAGQVPPTGSWSAVTNPPGTANNQYVVTNAVTGNKRFYRLSKP